MLESSVALYIMMYCDLPDMTGGKCAAQAAHASTMCTYSGEKYPEIAWDRWTSAGNTGVLPGKDRLLIRLYNSWKNSTPQKFGTTLVFRHIRGEESCCIPLNLFTSKHETFWGVVRDPTYPYRDTDRTIKTMDTVTCAWFLADRANPEHKATLDSIHKEFPFVLF